MRSYLKNQRLPKVTHEGTNWWKGALGENKKQWHIKNFHFILRIICLIIPIHTSTWHVKPITIWSYNARPESVFFLFRQWKNVVLCVFVWHVCDMCQCTHKSTMLRVSRSEDKFQELVSPPPWVPRLKLRSSALQNKHFSYWTILPALFGKILTQRHPYIYILESEGEKGLFVALAGLKLTIWTRLVLNFLCLPKY